MFYKFEASNSNYNIIFMSQDYFCKNISQKEKKRKEKICRNFENVIPTADFKFYTFRSHGMTRHENNFLSV